MDKMPDTTHDETPSRDAAFAQGLEGFLDAADQATTWHVERSMKCSELESTELVSGTPRDGGPGLYVRKRIDAGAGAGAAYGRLARAQREGACPACVPRVLECSTCSDELTVVMEYIEGCTVDSFVAACGAGEETALRVMPTLCRSVHELHRSFDPPLIHRDLKPSNVIMRGGKPVIIDFGCARAWREGAESDTAHFLTRCYAPPEQFGFGQTDERSDVYALGKMLLFCLVGTTPPNVCDEAACERLGVPKPLARVVSRACAFDPDKRYGSAAELADAIERAFAEKGGAPSAGVVAGSVVPPSADVPAESADGRGEAVGARWRTVAAGGLLAGASNMLGTCWNILVITVVVAMMLESVRCVLFPVPEDAGLTFAYLVLRYIAGIDVMLLVVGYLMLDKRRLRRRFGFLRRWTWFQELLYGCLGLFAWLIVVGFVATTFAT